ncbi:MAG: Gfo/Idh/MocA family protein [Beijerinckiaceae bacterium]
MATRRLRIGMIGIGVGGAEILRAMDGMETIEVVAGADLVPETLRRFGERFPEAKTYLSAEELCRDANVEAVWVSSPNRFHAEHTILAANHGKHIVVEKPMAISLEEAGRMVEAAEKNGVKLLAGHTRAFTVPIRAMRRIVQSGHYGELRALNIWSYSDWMLRPRTADELDIKQGGGIPYRQGPHQVDTVRLLGGGMVRSVRAQTGDWMKERPIPGYYSAFLEFENGLPATIVHNGYGYFAAAELVPWGTDKLVYTAQQRGDIRRQLRAGTRDETADKQSIRIGGSREKEYFYEDAGKPWIPEDMGFAIASLDRADLRQSQFGVFIHDDDGKHDVPVVSQEMTGMVQRRAELEELYDSVVHGKPLWHDGRWGMATLEVCLAIMQSAKERREIMLQHQTPVHADYDANMTVPTV